MVSKRNRRTKRAQRSNRRRGLASAVARIEKGHVLRPSADPPAYINCPFWPLTIQSQIDSNTTVTALDLHKAIIANLPSSFINAKFSFRLLSVRAWGLQKQPISLTPYEELGGAHQTTSIADYGSAMNYSRVGFRYGISSAVDIHTDSDTISFFSITGDLSDTKRALMLVNLLVRPSGPPAPKETPFDVVVDALRNTRLEQEYDMASSH